MELLDVFGLSVDLLLARQFAFEGTVSFWHHPLAASLLSLPGPTPFLFYLGLLLLLSR